ncbi:hypothetical protein HGM15179_019436 [Zosterops borbonicus]|uniref:Reverse transcriptase domain-containing protein n=1 Tax=Zosterops borbonicus TaxID=364589 RepID=A0A8K1D8S5_9PASS|nr:hypothetical protein HGM15179_019436 [Zosterops borbonicus]
MTAKVLKPCQEDEDKINKEVWAGKGNRGGLDIDPIRLTTDKEEYPIRVPQYPIALEGREGWKLVIEELIKDETLEPCMSPHNTPILPVKKPDGNYRLVQDLWEVKKRTWTRSDLGVLPSEMMFGLPFLTTQHETATYEETEMRVKEYVNTIAKTLENLRLKGIIPQTTPLEFKIAGNMRQEKLTNMIAWKEILKI